MGDAFLLNKEGGVVEAGVPTEQRSIIIPWMDRPKVGEISPVHGD